MQELSAASSSYARQARQTPRAQHAASSELQQTIAQLRAQLLAVEPDVEELEDAIAAIEEPGVARRLGISDSEVRSRRSVVQRIQGELEVCSRPHADRSGIVLLIRRELIAFSRRTRAVNTNTMSSSSLCESVQFSRWTRTPNQVANDRATLRRIRLEGHHLRPPRPIHRHTAQQSPACHRRTL